MVSVAIIVTAILLIYVIPTFESLFSSFGADLPAFTRAVVDLSVFVRTKGWLLLVLFVGAVAALIFFKKRSKKFAHFLDRMLLRIPLIGEIMRKLNMGDGHAGAEDEQDGQRDRGKLPVQPEQDAERQNGREQAADQQHGAHFQVHRFSLQMRENTGERRGHDLVGFGRHRHHAASRSEHLGARCSADIDREIRSYVQAKLDAYHSPAAESDADGADIARAVAQGEPYPLPMLHEPLPADDFLVETEASEGFACAEEAGYLVELDTALSEELIDEGVARELVRSVQDARKQAGLEVSDRIVLGISGTTGVEKALAQHRDYVMAETLATDWETGQSEAIFTIERDLGDEKWTVEFRKE